MEGLKQASNIVLSNGQYDPWSALGVTQSVSETVVAAIVNEGGHHLDLMFSNDADPPSVKKVRQTELEHIAKWIAEHKKAQAQ